MNAAPLSRKTPYPWFAAGLLALALLAAAPLVGSAFGIATLDWLDALLIGSAHNDMIYVGAVLGVLVVAALWIYVTFLSLRRPRRPRFWVFINWLAPALFAAVEIVCIDYASYGREFTLVSQLVAPGVALGVPLLVLLGEALVFRLCLGLGRGAGEHDWRVMALPLLRTCLRLRPERRDLRALAGRIYARNDDYENAVAMLDMLGTPEEIEDEPTLRAMESSYRGAGLILQTIEALKALQRRHPADEGLARRIVDDLIHLDRTAEALQAIENARLPVDVPLLKLRQELNLKLGRIEPAIDLTAQVAVREPAPRRTAIRLYQGLIQRQPMNLDLKVRLGELLLAEPAQADRREGARLLEEVLDVDPDRLELNRQLVVFYSENGEAIKTREHMLRLVERRDREPSLYLELAGALLQEGQPARAADVLRRMLEIHPAEWRGHHRLARALFESGDLDGAEAELEMARRDAPSDGHETLKPLEREVELRRHEQKVEQMRREIGEGSDSLEQRFALIDELLKMGWTAKAIAECDQLLEERPELMDAVEQRIGQGVERLEKNYQLRDYLGDLFFRQERYDDLLQVYRELADSSLHPSAVLIEGCRRILDRVPHHLETREELAAAYRLKEDWQGVVDTLDPLLALEPSPLEPLDKALWVEAAYMLGRNEDAAQLGMQLLEPLAEETGFMLMMVELHQRSDDHQTAREVFEIAEAARPQEPRLRSIRFQVMRKARLQRIAQLEARATAGEGLTAREHLEKAELHLEEEQLKPATIHFQRAADDPALRDIAMAKMAICLLDRGMYDLAMETLDPIELTRETVAAWPELKELIYSAARSMEKFKQKGDAARYFKKLFRADASYKDVVERLERLSG